MDTSPVAVPSATNIPSLTPQQRLAISRKAIVRFMHKGEPQPEDDAGATFGQHERAIPDSNWSLLRQALKSWWHNHPASIAAEIANPLLGQFARTSPVKLLAIAATAGAAVVLFKPWRLLSFGGVALAVLKSPDIAGAISSMIMRARNTLPK